MITESSMLLALRLAGLILSGLVLANFVAAKRFDYARNLAGSELLVRQVFYVHCAYIVVILAALALLCLVRPHLLLGDGMGRALCVFFAVFWVSRVVVQLTYYERRRRRQDRAWDIFFLGVFATLAVIFTLAGLVP